MLKPDVIVVQPTHCDFPLFRYHLQKYRNYYNKIMVSFHEGHHSRNYTSFMTQALEAIEVTCLGVIATQTDWRHDCIHAALPHTESNNILFLEQDVIMHENFEPALKKIGKLDDCVVGFGCKTGRLHPAFLFVPRKTVTANTYFGTGEGFDHFGAFTAELINSDIKFIDLEEIVPSESWEHLQGLTNNYSILNSGGVPNWQLERFIEYNKRILQLEIEVDPGFLELIKKGANL